MQALIDACWLDYMMSWLELDQMSKIAHKNDGKISVSIAEVSTEYTMVGVV